MSIDDAVKFVSLRNRAIGEEARNGSSVAKAVITAYGDYFKDKSNPETARVLIEVVESYKGEDDSEFIEVEAILFVAGAPNLNGDVFSEEAF